jgi:hypothetical protein
MMLQPTRLPRILRPATLLGVVLACGCGAAVAADQPVRTGASADAGSSLVLCMSVRAPVHAVGHGRELVRRIGDDRFFAPTRPAMFFSRPGDRCAWRGGPARG